MTEKGKRTEWKGDVFRYDELISNPSDTREDLYCLTWSQSKALIAAIDLYRYITRWEGGLPDANETEYFVSETQRRLMMPCGSDNTIPLNRWTDTGGFQESNDGGETWTDAPQKDPRNNVPFPPPFLPEGTEEAECTYADSIVNMAINAWINATGEGEDLATVVSGILAMLASIFGSFGGVIAAVILGIGASIVQFGVAAWKAAFTSDVWDRFRCNLHDNQNPDGTFTAAQVDAIYERLSVDETGIVLITLQKLVAALQWQGLTIAARQGYGSPTADCDCTDLPLVYSWDELSAESVIVEADEDGIYTAHSGVSKSGSFYVCSIFFQPELPVPAHWKCYDIVELSNPTGNTPTNYRCLDYTPDALASCVAQVTYFSSTSPFDLQFTIGDLCGEH